MWESYRKLFTGYLRLERSMSGHSVEAYLRDVEKLEQYLMPQGKEQISPKDATLEDLKGSVEWIEPLGMTDNSQARTIR